jgi:c-di-GMP-related signal transduction protein
MVESGLNMVLTPPVELVEAKPVAARQPIFDSHLRVFAYELLFRSSLDNFFDFPDGDQATSRVMDSVLSLGLDQLLGGRPAFINFTRETLMRDLATLLPAERLTVEVLETVAPDEEVVAACRRLKGLGYRLALDDITSLEVFNPLLSLADIVKVDFSLASERQKAEIPRQLRPRGVKLLAEKVEERGDFDRAVAWGYDYFQGFFFCSPEIIAARDIPAFKLNQLQLLKVLGGTELDFDEIEHILSRDLSFSYRLLRYLNSALFGLRSEVRSIRHALSLLGEIMIKRWVAMLVLAAIASDKPAELLRVALLRARFCELLSSPLVPRDEQGDFFLLGLFSVIDACLDQPMEAVAADLPLAPEIKEGLLGGDNLHGRVLQCVSAFERADWAAVTALADSLKLTAQFVGESYLQSVEWVSEGFC